MFRFFRIAFTSYRALFGWFTLKVYIVTKLINPIFQVVFYALLAGYANQSNDIAPFVIGNAILLCYRNAMFGVANNLAMERMFGTLKLNFLAPIKKITLFMGYGFTHVIDGLINILIGFIAGIYIFHLDMSSLNWGLFFLTLLVSVFATIGLGLLVGCLGLVITDMNLIANLMGMSLILFSGANFPITRFPEGLRTICYSIPMTRGIEASRLLYRGAGFAEIQSLLVQECLLGLAYILIGVCLLRTMETLAAKKASVELF